MRFRTAVRVSQSRDRPPFSLLRPQSHSRSSSQLRSVPGRPSFGIAFDIDGVVLRGGTPIGGSPEALRRLYDDSGTLKIPFLFLTNGGGIPESRRASELSELLEVKILPSQVVQGHSPFRSLLKRFENELIVATGKGEPALVMSEYGFKRVLSVDEYASYFNNIDPVSQYKHWTTKQASNQFGRSMDLVPSFNVFSDRVKAVFVVSDPVDWGRDIQVLCDILTSGGLVGEKNGHQPPLYFAADDLEYQDRQHFLLNGLVWVLSELPLKASSTAAAFMHPEYFSWIAFSCGCLTSFWRIHHTPLEYTSFGKPNPFVFKNAEAMLRHLKASSCHGNPLMDNGDTASHAFETMYMIGDNPLVDIKGARQEGDPWFSILTRTGVFKGIENHAEFPADLVVDTVEEAVEYIMEKEGTS